LQTAVESVDDLVMRVREKYHQIQYGITLDMIIKDFREGKLGNITLDDID
jgi:hypothetical protein